MAEPRKKAAARRAPAKKAPRWKRRLEGEIKWMSPDDLLAHPDNWRIHPDQQRAILEGGLDDLGWVDTVKVSKKTSMILDGHARVFLARQQGEEVPVQYVVDLSDAEERKILASLNSITALADTDHAALLRVLNGVDPDETHAELAALFDGLEAEATDAVETERKLAEQGNSNFGSIKKSFRERKTTIKAIFAIGQAELVENALRATGIDNRAEAIAELAKNYLDNNNGSEEAGANGSQAGEQQHDPKEAGFEAEVARALGA